LYSALISPASIATDSKTLKGKDKGKGGKDKKATVLETEVRPD
jgi:hypothetical protein